jgi:hypothetical protein
MIQASCRGGSSFPERFPSHSSTVTKLARRVSIGRFDLTKATTVCLDRCQYPTDLHWDPLTYPVAMRNSLIELLRECRQNSPEAEVEICIWLELGACIRILLRVTIAAIRGPGVRVSLGRTELNKDQISPKPGHSSLGFRSFSGSSTSHV